jgi:hypothetical protein
VFLEIARHGLINILRCWKKPKALIFIAPGESRGINVKPP